MQSNNLRKYGFRVMGILLFVASAIVTITYMLSNVMGIIACVVALIQGIGIESAKSFFSYIFIITKIESQAGKKAIFGILALLAFAISIVATTGFSINMSYKVQDFLLKKSDEYKNKQKFVTTQGDLYEQTKKQLDDMKSQRDQQISKMEKVRDSWGKNYKTMRSQEQDKINSAASKYNDAIQKKESELATIAGNLNQTTNESLKSEGFMGLYAQLAKFINDSRSENIDPKPVESADVSFWLNFAVAVCLEFFGIGFIYLSMKEESGGYSVSKHASSNIHTAGFKPIGTTASISNNLFEGTNSRKIGFCFDPPSVGNLDKSNYEKVVASENIENNTADGVYIPENIETPQNIEVVSPTLQKIDKESLNKYLQYIYENVDSNNLIPGYIKTARDLQAQNPALKFDAETVRKLKAYCENLNILKSNKASRKTYLIKPKDEMIQLTI